MISIFLNGDPRAVAASNVTLLVSELSLPPETLLVEHNGLALHRSEWPSTALKDGDRVEILKVAAGG